MTRGELDVARSRAAELAATISAGGSASAEEILGRRRFARIVAARRQLFAALWHDGYGLAEIARTLRLDHTTVIYGLRIELGDDAYDRELRERYPKSGWLRACRADRLERVQLGAALEGRVA